MLIEGYIFSFEMGKSVFNIESDKDGKLPMHLITTLRGWLEGATTTGEKSCEARSMIDKRQTGLQALLLPTSIVACEDPQARDSIDGPWSPQSLKSLGLFDLLY
jgi:hypothetical protein